MRAILQPAELLTEFLGQEISPQRDHLAGLDPQAAHLLHERTQEARGEGSLIALTHNLL